MNDATASGTPASVRKGYIPTLDGWRAIAVGAVIFFHSHTVTGPLFLQSIQKFAESGVQLFFAISGFLICSRLLEEQRLHGQLSIRKFYIRRFFRIQPAAVTFLASITILALSRVIRPTVGATLSALFLYRNYYAVTKAFSLPDDVLTAHFWSLAVEEHFYLVLPALIYFCRKNLGLVLCLLTVVFTAWEPIARHFPQSWPPELSHWRTDSAMHSLLIPALLAVWMRNATFRHLLTKISAKNLLVFLTAFTIVISKILFAGHLIGTLVAFGFPLLIVSTVLHPNGWLGRMLELAPFVFVGRISYSLYLWQQIFFTHDERPWLHLLQFAPWNIVAVFVCAGASYYLVEKPLLNFGHRIAPPATPGRPDLLREQPSKHDIEVLQSR